jgi:hypothetical protein
VDSSLLAKEALLPVKPPCHDLTPDAAYEDACELLSVHIEEHLLDRKNYRMFPKHDSVPPTIVIYVIASEEVSQCCLSFFTSSF